MVRFLHVCSIMCAVCFIAFLKSCVSCQALAEALPQNSTLTILSLYDSKIGPEGAKAWCPVRMGSWGEKRSEERQRKDQDTAVWKRRQGNDERQCNAALISRCIHPVEICDDKWLWYFHVFGMYWPDPGRKKETTHNSSISKTGHPVTLWFSNFRSSNQVWNGIPIIRMFLKLKWFTLLVTLPNCAGILFRW